MTKGKTQNRQDDLPCGERSEAVKIVCPTRRAWYHAREVASLLFDQGCMTSLHGFAIGDLKVEL